MIRVSGRKRSLPVLDGNDRRWAGVALDDVGFDHDLQIHLAPVFWGLFEHRVQVNGIRDELSDCLGSLPQNTRQDNDGLPCDIVMDSGYYCVIWSGARPTAGSKISFGRSCDQRACGHDCCHTRIRRANPG